MYDDIPSTYGLLEIMDIAEHFKMDNDDLSFQWNSFITFINDQSSWCQVYAKLHYSFIER